MRLKNYPGETETAPPNQDKNLVIFNPPFLHCFE